MADRMLRARKYNALMPTSCWWRLDTKNITFAQADIEVSLAVGLGNPGLNPLNKFRRRTI